MIRRFLKQLAPAMLIAVALVLPSLALAADPVVRLSVASPHDLDQLLGDLAKAGEKPDRAQEPRKMLTQMRLYEDNGLDTSKRLGAVMVMKDGAPPAPWLLLPVKDEKQFYAALKPFYPTQEALKDGRQKLVGEKGPPMAARIDKGWAYVTMLQDPEPTLPGDAEKLTSGKGSFDVTIAVSSMSDAQRKGLLEGIRSSAAQKEAAMPEDQRGKAHAGTEAFVTAMDKFLTNTDSITLALSLGSKEWRLDFEMHNKSGVAGVTPSATAPLGLSKLVPDAAAVGFTSDMSLDDLAKQALTDSAKQAFAQARTNGGPPSKLKFLDALETEVANLVKSGRLEAIGMFTGKKGDATFVGSMRTAPDSKLGDTIKLVADEIAKKPDGPKPVIKNEGNVTFFTVDVPANEKSNELGGHELGLAFRPGLAAIVFGSKTVDKLKAHLAAVDGGKAGDAGIGATKGWWALRSFADIFGAETFGKTKEDQETFLRLVTTGGDQVGFTLEPQKDGYKSSLYVQAGLVSLVCHGAMNQPGPGAGGPPAPDAAGPGSGPGVGPGAPPLPSAAPDVTPPRSESAAPAAAPSPDASGSASPSPSGEGEKKEESEPMKKEAGDNEKDKDEK